jgi:hypothetical protein
VLALCSVVLFSPFAGGSPRAELRWANSIRPSRRQGESRRDMTQPKDSRKTTDEMEYIEII